MSTKNDVTLFYTEVDEYMNCEQKSAAGNIISTLSHILFPRESRNKFALFSQLLEYSQESPGSSEYIHIRI